MSDAISKDKPIIIESSKLILCEGEDECDILTLFRTEQKKSKIDIEIISAGGRDKIDNKLLDLRAGSGGPMIKSVYLMIDSEEDASATQKFAAGFVLKHQTETLKIHVFQLPSATENGSIETLIRQGIVETSIGYDCAMQWEKCVQSDAKTTFDLKAKLDKAWLQVWLTHRTKSTASRIGYAIKNNADLRKELIPALQPIEQIFTQCLTKS